MRMAAIYARVSSEQQREANTIASQTASLIEFAQRHDLEVPKEWVFEEDGYSGATLERPGLERVRDLARRRANPGRVGLRTGPAEPQVCVPDSADRGVSPQRGGNAVYQSTAGIQRGRSTAGTLDHPHVLSYARHPVCGG